MSMVLIFTVQAAPRVSSCVEKSSIFVSGSSQDVSNCPADPFVDSSEASVQINITQNSAPVVEMVVLSNYDAIGIPSQGNTPARTVFILSSSAPIRVVGTIAKSDPSMSFVSISWTLDDEPSVTCMSANDWCNPKNLLTNQCVSKAGYVDELLGQCVMKSNGLKLGSVCMDSQCTYGLGIGSAVFSRARGTYRLRLSAIAQNGQVGSAAINIRFKPGPNAGYVDISQMEGIALSTVFTITASYWQDFDENGPPLVYSFSYREEGCFEIACFSLIKTNTISNMVGSVFPPGNITVTARISDSLGASTSVDTNISVFPPEISLNSLNFSIRNLISNSTDDVEGIIAGISAAAKTLNYFSRMYGGNVMQDELQIESSLRSFLIESLAPYIMLLGQTQKVPPEIVLQFTSALVSTLVNHASVPQKCLSLIISCLRILASKVLDVFKNYLNADIKMQPFVEEAEVLSKQMGNAINTFIAILQFIEIRQSSLLVERSMTPIHWQMHGRKINLETEHPGNYYVGEVDWFLHSRAEKASFSYIDGLLELISQVSALSVGNSIPSQSPIRLTFDPFLQIVTQRVEGSSLSGKGLFLSRAYLGYEEINDPCLLSHDIEKCCVSRVNGSGLPKCCFGDSCSHWTEVSWVSTPVIALLPSKVESSPSAYEAQLSLLDSSLFDSSSPSSDVAQQGSTVHLVRGSDAVMIQIRQFHSNIPLPQQFYKSPATVRLPLASRNIGVGCVTWDETEKRWSIAGLQQSKNVSSVKTFCIAQEPNGNSSILLQPQCATFLECSVPYFGSGSLSPYPDSVAGPDPGLLRIFGASELWVDCAGSPLGPAILDYCNVCGGDNSTCSGCDGIPNKIVDGIQLDKKCSGHGSCSGSVQCQCCAGGLHLLMSDSNTGSNARTNSSAECPWFGVMCQHFCSRSAVANSPPGSINCSGHGSCDPLTGAFCICDPDYVNTPAGSCTTYLMPPQKPMDPALWYFLAAGIPGLFLVSCMACIVWYKVSRTKKTVKNLAEQVEDAVLNHLTPPAYAEVASGLQIQGNKNKEEEQLLLGMRPKEAESYLARKKKAENSKHMKKRDSKIDFDPSFFRRTDEDELNPHVTALLTLEDSKMERISQSLPYEIHSDTYQRTSALKSRREVASEELRKLMDKASIDNKGGQVLLADPIWVTHKSAWEKAKEAWTSTSNSNSALQYPQPAVREEDIENSTQDFHQLATQNVSLSKSMASAEKRAQDRGKSGMVPSFITESAKYFKLSKSLRVSSDSQKQKENGKQVAAGASDNEDEAHV